MRQQNYPVIVRIYFLFDKSLDALFVLLRACLIGFWLGVLKKETLQGIDQYYYDSANMYCNEKYNKSGLWKWEKQVLSEYFQNCTCLLVAGAGGGREILALQQLGYNVDGFECNIRLADFANNLLKREGFVASVQLALRDECPNSDKLYDGIIIGWGAYMLIQGRKQRVDFLKELRAQMSAGAPLLLSFFSRANDSLYFKLILVIGNVIRWLLGRDALELGDALVPNYVHHFTQDEVIQELHAGGVDVKFYSTDSYGHAVGIAS